MNDLVTVKRNDVFTDSLVIAQGTGVEHESVVAHLKKYSKDFEEFGGVEFTDFKSGKRGRPTRVYQLNEEQATLLVTYLGNTKAVRDFKRELVKQFYKMRNILLQKQTSDWVETRRAGKLTRKSETDVIKELTQYAAEQGSTNSDKLYMVYSKLANRTIGVSDRELATILQINNLSLAENIILHCIKQGMAEGKHYKEIYQDSKARLELFKDIALIEAN